MKEKPILFSTPMVRAILKGRKTQTRRICKPQPVYNDDGTVDVGRVYFDLRDGGWDIPMYLKDQARWEPGDILWVREAWNTSTKGWIYRADGIDIPSWKPSIFMPRRASRILLEVTDVRVERLQEISEEDAITEGIEPERGGWKSYEIIHSGRHKGEPDPHSFIPNKSPVTSYRELWESINGLGSWEKNLWVWVISFKWIQP